MKPELEDKLIRRFPKLYGQHNKPMPETCMCWGFECGDGWFDLIWELSEKLEQFDELEAFQVKEKFGGLRFYTNYYFEEAEKHIEEAMNKSMKTCEVCGKPGKLYSDGWCSTRCKEHKR